MTKRNHKGLFKKGHQGKSALSMVRKHFPNVERVTDANKDIEIEVEARDAKRGKKYDHNGCALAVACKDKLHLSGVIVAMSTAYLIKGKEAVRYAVPESATREIISFDRSGVFEPGLYKLKAPEAARRLGHRPEHKPGNTGTGKPIRYRHITNNVRAVLGSKGGY